MRLRPLNDTIFVEPDPIVRHDGIIKLPDDNSIEKISPWVKIVSYGNKCFYKFRTGQRVLINKFFDKPEYVAVNGKRYRMIKEHYIHAVDEDA